MVEADASVDDEPVPRGGRVARNRQRRADVFLRAALRIVTEDGIEALTMARLADDVDTAVGAVYRYFPSKAHLIAAVQNQAIERLREDYERTYEPLVQAVNEAVPDQQALVALVALGRWLATAADVFPEEVRLLQMISARRNTALPPGGGEAVAPAIMRFLAPIAASISHAADVGATQPGSALARTIMWLTAFGGVLQADDLARYVPDILGGGRLARQLNIDLLVGWGADPEAVATIDHAISEVAESVKPAKRAQG